LASFKNPISKTRHDHPHRLQVQCIACHNRFTKSLYVAITINSLTIPKTTAWLDIAQQT